MLEYNVDYYLGRTVFYMFWFQKAQWILFAGILILGAGILLSIGEPRAWFSAYLARFPTLYLAPMDITIPIMTLGVCLIALSWVRGYLAYAQYRFYVDEHAFHFRRGIFFIRETRIPYTQIVNVDIDRPYHFRLMGLAKLDIRQGAATDTGVGKDRSHLLPMVELELAQALSNHLLVHNARNMRGQSVYEDDF